jgi:hypothetical protein
MTNVWDGEWLSVFTKNIIFMAKIAKIYQKGAKI